MGIGELAELAESSLPLLCDLLNRTPAREYGLTRTWSLRDRSDAINGIPANRPKGQRSEMVGSCMTLLAML